MGFDYTIIRSARRTSALQLKNGEIIVRVPKRMTDTEVRRFVENHTQWLEKHLSRQQQEAEQIEPLSAQQLLWLTEQAKCVIPERVAYYAPLVGVNCNRISILAQRTRWGSCSAKGSLCFNCLLMLAPVEVLDSVVVHELCHLKHMNHSKSFYCEVRRVMPDYDRCHGWLRENGGKLIRRMIAGKAAERPNEL